MRAFITRLPAHVFLLAFASCAIHVDMPTEFLVTHETSSQFKATTADGAIFIVERYELPKKGDNLAFWVDAIKNHFLENLGYVAIEESGIETSAGDRAVQMVFETTTAGRTYRYLMTVCVQRATGLFGTGNPIACVARFTAEKDNFDEHVEAIKTAMLTIRD